MLGCSTFDAMAAHVSSFSGMWNEPVYDLIKGRLSDTARLVREARLGISEYVRSTVDYIEVDRQRRLEFGGKLTTTQRTRFSLFESADFGWGKANLCWAYRPDPNTTGLCILARKRR
ncbi:hypothetical protein CRYUN_Cryun03dG0000200 [Craigia yunnanensis]